MSDPVHLAAAEAVRRVARIFKLPDDRVALVLSTARGIADGVRSARKHTPTPMTPREYTVAVLLTTISSGAAFCAMNDDLEAMRAELVVFYFETDRKSVV